MNAYRSAASLAGPPLTDKIETALVAVILRVVQAPQLRLWQVVHRAGETVFLETIRTPNGGTGETTHKNPAHVADLTIGASQASLRKCLEGKAHLRLPTDPDGLGSELFPAFDGRDILYILEICGSLPLSRAQKQLIVQMLRIYCKLAEILNTHDRDELTGLLNRRSFHHTFKQIIAPISAAALAGQVPAAERRRGVYKTPITHLAAICIDGFDRIIDKSGHPQGGEVLAGVARMMTVCFREKDSIFSFGGANFVVTLPDTDFQDAEIALERLLAGVAAFEFPKFGRITLSIGFTKLLGGDRGADACARARQALRFAQDAGQNQIQLYELLAGNGSLVPDTAGQKTFEKVG